MTRRVLVSLVTTVAMCVAATHLRAQEKKDAPDPSEPGPEHKVLESLVGTYDAKVKFFVEPGKPPEESSGVMKRKPLMGGRYLQEDYEGKIGTVAFTGMGLIGFDKFEKKYMITWIDSMSTGIMVSSGTYDADKKTFTYQTSDVDPNTGKKMKGRDILRIDSPEQQTLEMYRQPVAVGSKESKVLEIVYTRKK